MRFATRNAGVRFDVPDAGRVDATGSHGLVLGTTIVGSRVAVAVVLALGVDVVPHAGRVGLARVGVEVHVVALLLADGSGGVPFAHGRALARSLGGESAAAFRADTTLRVPFAGRRLIAIDLVEELDLA